MDSHSSIPLSWLIMCSLESIIKQNFTARKIKKIKLLQEKKIEKDTLPPMKNLREIS